MGAVVGGALALGGTALSYYGQRRQQPEMRHMDVPSGVRRLMADHRDQDIADIEWERDRVIEGELPQHAISAGLFHTTVPSAWEAVTHRLAEREIGQVETAFTQQLAGMQRPYMTQPSPHWTTALGGMAAQTGGMIIGQRMAGGGWGGGTS